MAGILKPAGDGAADDHLVRRADGQLHGSQKRYLSPDEEEAVRAAWAEGIRRDEVAARAGITVSRLVARLKDQLADLPRRGQGKGGGRRRRDDDTGIDPTREEIMLRCAEVRRGWGHERYGIDTLDPVEQALRYMGHVGVNTRPEDPGDGNFADPAGGRSTFVDHP